MQRAAPPWQPRLDDYVLVGATGDIGEVTEVIDTGADRQFVVSIRPPPNNAKRIARTVMHRVCTRDGPAPARMP